MVSIDTKDTQKIRLDFLVGIPSGKSVSSNFDGLIQQWIGSNPVGRTRAISNRVDWNRTLLWDAAKQYDTSLIMIDTDVYPATPYPEVKNYIYEDFADGYDVVFAPLLTHDGQLMFSSPNMENYKKHTPYEAFHSGFGFTAMSKRIVRTLLPLTHMDIIDESLDMLELDPSAIAQIEEIIKGNIAGEMPPIEYHSLGASLPIYFSYSAQLSEDTQFCRRMRKMGIKMAIDPRIVCQHMTEVPFVFNVEQVTKAMDEQEKKQKVAVEEQERIQKTAMQEAVMKVNEDVAKEAQTSGAQTSGAQ